MSKLIDAVHSQEPTIIFQKKLRIQTRSKQDEWVIKELELYTGQCKPNEYLGKAFGIGALAVKQKDNLAYTWDHTYFDASSNVEDAHLVRSECTNSQHSVPPVHAHGITCAVNLGI